MADRLLFTGHRTAQRSAGRAASRTLSAGLHAVCAGFIPPAAAVGAARQYCGRCAQHRDHHTEEPITVNVDRAGLTVSGPGPGQATHVDRLVSPNNAGLDVAM